MKKKLFAVAAACILAMLSIGSAFAVEISFTGIVSSEKTVSVYAPIGGTVAEVLMQDGTAFEAGSTLITLKSAPVIAKESGTVHIFGNVGDDCEDVAATYGAVVWLEPDSKYSVAASTQNAYDNEENKWIVPGETVYMRSTDNNSRKGAGIVTSVTGTDYTVLVTDCGSLILDDPVNIFRQDNYDAKSRIGKGKAAKLDPAAYTAVGSIASFNVEDGAHVEKGDVLFETLTGTWDKGVVPGKAVVLPASGSLVSCNVSQGDTVSKNQVLATYYPSDALCVEVTVSEGDLPYISVGKSVTAEFSTAFTEVRVVNGKITSISMIGASSANESQFTVKIALDDYSLLRYGMHCTVSVSDESDTAVAE